MAKKQSKNRRARRNEAAGFSSGSDQYVEKRQQESVEPIKPKTPAQKTYMNLINCNQITFGLGPAGTGKTYIAAAMAADALRDGKVKQIIITRPAVEAGENLGFLPGELEEKFAPYLAPVAEVMKERLGASHFEYLLKVEKIKVVPFAFMRGHTFKDAFVLLDEAQNTTPAQMYLFLSRIGEDTRVVIDGDLIQLDITGKSGLFDATEKLNNIKDIAIFSFTPDDIVRSDISKKIISVYNVYRSSNDNEADSDKFKPHNVPTFLSRGTG